MSSDTATRPDPPGDRVAIVAGVRTPFLRQFTAFRDCSGVELAVLATAELLARTALDPTAVQRVVFGQVGIQPEAPNVARELVLGAGLPVSTDAYSVSRACTTSFQATADVAAAIRRGDITAGLCGGADSTSVLPIQLGRGLARALIGLSKTRGLRRRLALLRTVKPRDLLPRAPAVRDYSTGLGMGEIAEQMARDHHISREEQDRFALRSHHRAAAAWRSGKLADEVAVTIPRPFTTVVEHDNTVREDTSADALAALEPVFDSVHGTVTAGNSSPLTDGAAALLLMHEGRARACGLEPLGYLRSEAFTANDPFRDGLMGPSHATPIALERAGATLADMTLIDMHEAFAAQALANIRYWPSRRFARDVLGRDQPIGEVDPDRFNVLGGSIAFGHPFAATGARMIIQTINELRRRGGGLGLVTACAAGGLGAAMVLEVA